MNRARRTRRSFGNAMRFALLLLLALVWVARPSAAAEFDPAHSLYARVLDRFVAEELVDYRGLRADPKDLERYLADLASFPRPAFERWSQAEQIAFLVNLYNAAALKLIVDHYPVQTIKEIGGFVRGPFRQPVVRAFGETVTLDTVEHEWLRKRYAEPRVHFALVCASMGCPPLRGEPYVGAHLDAQLDDQARIFLSTPQKNRFDAGEGVFYLSPIFQWFREDFETKSSSVLAFVLPYLPRETARAVQNHSDRVRLDYTEYDWSLNDAARRAGARSRSEEVRPGAPDPS